MQGLVTFFSNPLRAAAVVALVLGIGLLGGNATALHDEPGGVELDGNIANDAGVNCASGDPTINNFCGTDWAQMFQVDGSKNVLFSNGDPLPGAVMPPNTVATAFVKDFVANSNTDTSYFQPSTKDFQEINAAGGSDVWGCTSQANATDKDDILNAYIVAVDIADPDNTNGAINRFVYVGTERFDNAGTAFLGFWLFQKKVTCKTTADGGTGKFEVEKTPGDILLLANFSAGGDTVNLIGLKWVASGGTVPNTNGHFVPLGGGGKCKSPSFDDTVPPNTDACTTINGAETAADCTNAVDDDGDGVVNDGCGKVSGQGESGAQCTNSIDDDGDGAVNDGCPAVGPITSVPWNTKSKKTGTDLDVNQFIEAGINLNDLLGTSNPPCFPSALVETRSSDSITATLKDYALASFQHCGGITIIKDAIPDSSTVFTYTDNIPGACVINDNNGAGVGTGLIDDGANDLTDRTTCLEVQSGTYTVTETPIPAGWRLSNISCTVTGAGTSVQFKAGAGAAHNPPFVDGDDTVVITLASGGEVTCTFTNRTGSLVIRKESLKGNALLGGASFRICPHPVTGVACSNGAGGLTVADNGAGDVYNTTAGMICIDDVKDPGAGGYSITETVVPTGYAGGAAQTGIAFTQSSCAARLTAAGGVVANVTANATFVNTPLSTIEVIFSSLAGPGVTTAKIRCFDGTAAGTELTPVPPKGDATPALFDDLDELYGNGTTTLVPGSPTAKLYTCTVEIDP